MYACNMVTQPGETEDFKVSDHVRLLNQYLGKRKINVVVANNGKIDEEMAKPEICSNSVKLQELQKEKDSLEEEMMTLMERWEELSEELNG